MNNSSDCKEQHNREQRDYFESTTKQTLIPRDTAYIRRQIEEVIGVAKVTAEERVLEVGCGMGRHIFGLADKGIRVEGLELSPVLIDLLHQHGGGRFNIPVHCCDVVNFPPELKGKFDAIIGFFVLHHLHDLCACFSSMAKLLKPGGRVAFVEPNPYNPLYYVQILFTPGMTWQGDRGIVNMRRSIVFRALQTAGLHGHKLRTFGFLPPLLANLNSGRRVEASLEKLPFLQIARAFQIFSAEKR